MASPGPPATPTAPTVAYLDDQNTVRLTWSVPAAGAGIASYLVTPTPSTGLTGTCLNLIAVGTNTCDFSGLLSGTSYTFRVTANGINNNTNGNTGSSSPSPASVAKIAGPPGAPLNAVLTRASDTSVTLTWSEPAAGAAPVSRYTVTTSNMGVNATELSNCGSNPASRTCTFTGLTATTAYTFQVASAGDVMGVVSAGSATAGPLKPGAPGRPDAPTVQLGDLGNVTVTWNQPAGGVPDSYVVSATPTTGQPNGRPDCTTATTSCNFTGLANNQAYTFTVTAVRSGYLSLTSVASDPAVSATPATPTSVTAVLGNAPGKATVTWTQPANGGDVSYFTVTPYVGATPGPSCAAGPSATSCTLTGLSTSSSYTFVVTAVGDLGSGVSAATAPALVLNVPNAPTALAVAVATTTSATVTWGPPAGGGGVVASQTVTVTGAGSPTVPSSCLTASSASCTVTGLTAGSSYTFAVAAVNAAGTSTAATSAWVVIAAPGAPTSVAVAVTSTTAATVTWAVPVGGAGPVVSYTVTVTGAGTAAAEAVRTPCSPTSSSTFTCSVTGLTSGGTYAFVVSATNAADTTPATGVSVVIAAPGAPTAVTVAIDGSGTAATVSWAAPAAGSGPVVSYTVTATGSVGASGVTTPCNAVSASTLTCSVSGLTAGATYTFVVSATNAVASTPATGVAVVMAAPGAPTSVAVAVTSTTAATVTWAAPAPGGGPVVSYAVTASGSGSPVVCPSVSASAMLTCAVTGLTSGQTYSLVVTATNAVASTPATGVTVVMAAPGAPTSVAVTITSTTAATVTWAAPAPGGGPVVSYAVTASGSGSPVVCPSVSASATLTCAVTGLQAGGTYTFVVTATNGISSATASSASVKMAAPGMPTSVAVVVASATSATVTWSAPAGGAGPVVSYTVTVTPGANTSGESVTTPCSPATSSTYTCSVTGLTAGGTYAFVVSATNGVTSTPAAGISVVIARPNKPGTPTAVLNVDGGTALVSWTAPPTGGGPVVSYTVTSVGSSPATVTSCVTIQTLYCSVTGIVAGGSYSFVATANNAVNTNASNASTVVLASAPGVPGTPTVQITGLGQATVSWTAPVSGGPVTNYSVAASAGTTTPTGCTNVAGLTCQIANLDAVTAYTFTVTAHGAAGDTPSLASSAVRAGVPSVPMVSTVVNSGANAVKLTWAAATAGGPVTTYTVVSNPAVSTPAGCADTVALTCIFDHLVSGTSYTFRVKAVGPAGESNLSTAVGPIVAGPPDVPGKPTVALTTGSGEVRVSWAVPSVGAGISGYTVESDNGGFGCSPVVTWCVVPGLDLTTAHRFRVQAVGNLNSGTSAFSPWSDPITAGDGSGPNQPGIPVALVSGVGQVVVRWQAPTDGGQVTAYSVTASPQIPAAGVSCADSTTVVPCVFTGLDPVETYTFTVRAAGPGGYNLSTPSNSVTPGAPAIPGSATVQSTVAGTVAVTWTPSPAGNGGGPVTSYSVTANPSVLPPGACTRTASSATGCSFSGLDPSTSYTFLVTANGPAGSTRAAVRSSAIVPNAPGAPGMPTVQVNPNGTATVKWAAPTTGGSVTGYTVTASTIDPAPAQSTYPACVGVTASTCVFDGLDAAKSYTFAVQAIGPAGPSGSSAPSLAISTAAPGALVKPTVALAGPNAVRVTWAAPAAGGPVAGYAVLSFPVVYPSAECTNVLVFTCIFDRLASGVSYTFTVRATGVTGGVTTSPATDAIIPGPPDAPAKPAVTSSGSGQVTVSWSEPSLGAGIRSYTVVSSPSGFGCSTNDILITTTIGSAPTSCTIAGLGSAAYKFRVQAVGAIGSGSSAFSPWSDSIAPSTPSAPTNVGATAGNQQITVAWMPSGTGSVAYYQATAMPGEHTCTPFIIGTACVIGGLTNGTVYTVTVTAIGIGGGNSLPSTPPVSARPTAGAPGVPAAVVATAGDGSALISWTAPTAIGDGIVQYIATAGPGRTCSTTGTLSCTITGLTNGTSYQVTVVAVGAGVSGTSASSTPVPVQPAATVAASPVTSVTVTSGALTLAVGFAPTGNVSNVINYTATAVAGTSSLSCTTASATTTSCVITDVVAGTTYDVTVVANLTGGTRSAPSTPAKTVTAVSYPAPVLPSTIPSSSVIYGPLTSSVSGSLPVGSSTVITGSTYASFAAITVGIYPSSGTGPVALATGITDASGQFSVTVPITGVTAGSYTIVAVGARTSSTVRYRSLSVTVTGPQNT